MESGETKSSDKILSKLGLPYWSARVPESDYLHDLPVDSDSPERRRPAESLGTAAQILAERIRANAAKVGDTAENSGKIIAAWRLTAGKLAEKFVPERYVAGVLYIAGGNSAEVFEFRRLHQRKLETAAKRHPEFSGLRQIRIRAAR